MRYVVRAGIARPTSLIVGTAVHRTVPGLTGFSVQSFPGVSVNELARAGQFRNPRTSVMTLDTLWCYGFELVFPTPGKGVYHATEIVPYPLTPDIAAALSRLFTQRDNPHPASKGNPG